MENNELEELEPEELFEDYSDGDDENLVIEDGYVNNSNNSATSFISNARNLRQRANDLRTSLNKNNKMANSSIRSSNVNKNMPTSNGSKVPEKLGNNSNKLSALKQAMNYRKMLKNKQDDNSESAEASLDPAKEKAAKNETKRQIAGDMAKQVTKAIIDKIPPALKLKILLVIVIVVSVLLLFLAVILYFADEKFEDKAATVSYIATGQASYKGGYYDIKGYLLEAGYCIDEDCNTKNAYKYISGIEELFEDYNADDCIEAGYKIDEGVNLIVATATYQREEEEFFGLDMSTSEYSKKLDGYLEEYENLIEASFDEKEVKTDGDTLTCYSFNEDNFKDYVVSEEGYLNTYRDDLGSLTETDRNNYYDEITSESEKIKSTIEDSNNMAGMAGGGQIIYNAGEYSGWKQFDSRWGGIMMGQSNKTIKQIGCLVTSIAIQMARADVKLNNGNELNPGNFVLALNASSGSFTSGGGLYWASVTNVASNFHYMNQIKIDGYTNNQKVSTITSYMQQGYYVVAHINGSKTSNTSNHWIAIVNSSNNDIYMLDPGKSGSDLLSVNAHHGLEYVDQFSIYKKS